MTKRRYPKEFRDEVVAMARKREITIRQIAKDFGVAEPTIYEWLKKASNDDNGEQTQPNAGLTDIEVRGLLKRNRQLEQELEVLRRATAYFSQAVLPK